MNEYNFITGLNGKQAFQQVPFYQWQLEVKEVQFGQQISQLFIYLDTAIIIFISGDIHIYDLYKLEILFQYKNIEFIKSPPLHHEIYNEIAHIYFANFVIQVSKLFEFKKIKTKQKIIGLLNNNYIDLTGKFHSPKAVSPGQTIIKNILKHAKTTIKQLQCVQNFIFILLNNNQLFYILNSSFFEIQIPFKTCLNRFSYENNYLIIHTDCDAILMFQAQFATPQKILRTVTDKQTSVVTFKYAIIYTSCGPISPEVRNGFFVNLDWFPMPGTGSIYRLCDANDDFLIFGGNSQLTIILASQGGHTPEFDILQLGTDRQNLSHLYHTIRQQKYLLPKILIQPVQFGLNSPVQLLLSQNMINQQTPPLASIAFEDLQSLEIE
ncbi:hypothetical protein SS50377_23034 [Spironucleus salmonicida]|uniref:Uncharacterized protein n=1 Tax=Spironucleus salmonicida TaxID=348837 RepID=V6LV73_9EUKA|nr:hypothetical protein SS50377_23034 [Spironucleus salmonicida]|eukprot:EST47611.1 Hypothetical protein SS50377_12306 [Spironucleus salmonicida]